MSALQPNIIHKYHTAFYFYTSKSINELIYSIGNPNSIQFDDLKTLYDELQYLRRIYKIKTLDGRLEIQERIKAVSSNYFIISQEYYHQNCMLTWEHPFMFVTNHKDIILKRQKRLRQLKQNQLQEHQHKPITQNQQNQTQKSSSSLDFKESSQQDPNSTFLNDLSLSFDILMNEENQEYLDINDELDSSLHDVFEDPQIQSVSQKYLQLNNRNQPQQQPSNIFKLQEPKLSHLVCDFQDFDIDQAINFYKEIVKSKNGSAIMSEILQEEHIKVSRKSSQNSKSKENIRLKTSFPSAKPPLPKISKQSILQSYISIFGSKKPKSKEKLKLNTKIESQKEGNLSKNKVLISKYLDEAKIIRMKSVENEEEVIQGTKNMKMLNSKTKIRQKAEQLLDKIRRQSFSVELR